MKQKIITTKNQFQKEQLQEAIINSQVLTPILKIFCPDNPLGSVIKPVFRITFYRDKDPVQLKDRQHYAAVGAGSSARSLRQGPQPVPHCALLIFPEQNSAPLRTNSLFPQTRWPSAANLSAGFYKPQTNEIIQYLSLCDWIISLDIKL